MNFSNSITDQACHCKHFAHGLTVPLEGHLLATLHFLQEVANGLAQRLALRCESDNPIVWPLGCLLFNLNLSWADLL
jgi:hypothetical protein